MLYESQKSTVESFSGVLPNLLPVRMLNEYAYCPRLGYMMWVQGEFEENFYTEDGSFKHRRVDNVDEGLSPPVALDAAVTTVARSVWLSAPKVGLTSKIDLVEAEGEKATPVDYKRGKKPDIKEGAWEPERVQLCAQGLILKENGYISESGFLYFVESKTRVEIKFDDDLIRRTLFLLGEFRKTAAMGLIPAPLDHSRKCEGCSLVGICLPDELDLLVKKEQKRTEPRQLLPALNDALPVYVQAQGAVVGKKGDELIIKQKGTKVAEAKLFETSQVCLFGNIQISTQTVQELCRRGIPVVYMSTGGWYYGMTMASMHKNIELRINQYKAAVDPSESLALARRFISSKIRNCRTILRRNGANIKPSVFKKLRESSISAETCKDPQELLGIEGNAARLYFQNFSSMLKATQLGLQFDFNGRNRRPPLDPVNAMLSLAYSLLTRDLAITLTSVGFDPNLGFFHRPRYGRPSLALDLMEEFRPIIADSVVITAINTHVVTPNDFIGRGLGVNLTSQARKNFILAYERRMDQLVRHPVFGYQISYRRVLEVQARLLARFLSQEIKEYPQFLTR